MCMPCGHCHLAMLTKRVHRSMTVLQLLRHRQSHAVVAILDMLAGTRNKLPQDLMSPCSRVYSWPVKALLHHAATTA